MKKLEHGWRLARRRCLHARFTSLASLRRPPVASGRRVDHFAVQHRTARHDRRPQLPSPYSFSTGFERVAMVARSTCSMTIKPARSRRSVPTRFLRRTVRPRSPARRNASTSAAPSTQAGPPCPSSTRPRTSADTGRVKTRSESSPLGGNKIGNSIDVGQG